MSLSVKVLEGYCLNSNFFAQQTCNLRNTVLSFKMIAQNFCLVNNSLWFEGCTNPKDVWHHTLKLLVMDRLVCNVLQATWSIRSFGGCRIFQGQPLLCCQAGKGVLCDGIAAVAAIMINYAGADSCTSERRESRRSTCTRLILSIIADHEYGQHERQPTLGAA